MEPWEVMICESQERMVAVVAPADARRRGGAVRPLGAASRGDRRGHGHGVAARVLGGRGRGRDSGAAAHRRVPALPRRAGPRVRSPAHSASSPRPRTRARWSSCSARANIRSRALDLPAATTISSARGPCAGRGSTRRCCGCVRAIAGSPSRSTDRGGWRGSTRGPGGALAVLEAARNVACAGGEPLGLTDCLNFGNPEKARDRLGAV